MLNTQAVPFVEIRRFALDIPTHIHASNQLLSHDPNTKQLRLSRHDPRNGTCRWLIEKHGKHHHIRCVNDRPDEAIYIGAPSKDGALCLYTGPSNKTAWRLSRNGRGDMYRFEYAGETVHLGQLQIVVHKQSDNIDWLRPYSNLVRLVNESSMHESWLKHLSDPQVTAAARTIFCTTDTIKHVPEFPKLLDNFYQLPELGSLCQRPSNVSLSKRCCDKQTTQHAGVTCSTVTCDGDLTVDGARDSIGTNLKTLWGKYQQATSGVSMEHHENINTFHDLQARILAGQVQPDTPVYKSDTHSLLQSFLTMCGLHDGRDKRWYHEQQLSFFPGDCFVASNNTINSHDRATYTRVLSEVSRMNSHERLGDMIMQRVWLYLLNVDNFSGPVAQRLEQRTHNPLVVGSNPTGPTMFEKHLTDALKRLEHIGPVLQQIEPLLEQALSKKSFSKNSSKQLLEPLTKLFAPD